MIFLLFLYDDFMTSRLPMTFHAIHDPLTTHTITQDLILRDHVPYSVFIVLLMTLVIRDHTPLSLFSSESYHSHAHHHCTICVFVFVCVMDSLSKLVGIT